MEKVIMRQSLKKISPDLKVMSFQIRKSQQVPSLMNKNRTTHVHLIGKFGKGNEEDISKEQRKNSSHMR
jgi:hypothetical protein